MTVQYLGHCCLASFRTLASLRVFEYLYAYPLTVWSEKTEGS